MWKYSDLLRNIYKKTGTHDPFKIAMYFDIPTYYVQIDSPLAKTIYLYGQPIILLSDKLQESSAKYYVCGHELGHIFKHTGIVSHMIVTHILDLTWNVKLTNLVLISVMLYITKKTDITLMRSINLTTHMEYLKIST